MSRQPPLTDLDPPPPSLDLLVVGGLTVDAFPDGRREAGGTVLHATRAAHFDGRRVGVLALAGAEPAAARGLIELDRLSDVHVLRADRSIAFRHGEEAGRRSLVLTSRGGPWPALPDLPPARAILYAPLFGELSSALPLAPTRRPGTTTGAILQGWLRAGREGDAVRAVRPSELESDVVTGLRALDLLIASVEDLGGDEGGAPLLVDELRATFGPRPIVAVTAGRAGAWLGIPGDATRHVPPSRAVSGVPEVGAGDAFAAILLAGLSRGLEPVDAAAASADVVAELLAERSGRRIHVVGDVHGALDALLGRLRTAGLVDADRAWAGGRDELWFAGDLVDRGADGLAVVDLVNRWQAEAAEAGGRVGVVLGNHEVQLLAARTMPDASAGGRRATFHEHWMAYGGQPGELASLSEEQASWIRALPVATRVGDTLLVHSDAGFYARLGPTLRSANAAVRDVLARPDADTWSWLLDGLAERRAFRDDPDAAPRLLRQWGGRRVVHGHTRVSRLFDVPAGPEAMAVEYAHGRAVAVDGGVYAGGSVILYTVPRA